MALVPASSSSAPAAGGLNPGSSISSGGGGWPALAGTLTPGDSLFGQGVAAFMGNSVSTNWPLANLAILVPFQLPAVVTVRHVAWFNGAGVSGNVDCGVYNEDGTRVITCGSTAQAGTNVAQIASVTATPLAAGSYYFALCIDNITATVFALNPQAPTCRGFAIVQSSAAVPLAASLTFAAAANGFIPQFIGLGATTVF